MINEQIGSNPSGIDTAVSVLQYVVGSRAKGFSSIASIAFPAGAGQPRTAIENILQPLLRPSISRLSLKPNSRPVAGAEGKWPSASPSKPLASSEMTARTGRSVRLERFSLRRGGPYRRQHEPFEQRSGRHPASISIEAQVRAAQRAHDIGQEQRRTGRCVHGSRTAEDRWYRRWKFRLDDEHSLDRWSWSWRGAPRIASAGTPAPHSTSSLCTSRRGRRRCDTVGAKVAITQPSTWSPGEKRVDDTASSSAGAGPGRGEHDPRRPKKRL